MTVKGSIKKTIEFLKKNPNTKYTTREIAEWFFENENDWCMRKRDESKQDLSQDKKLKQQIASEISRARIDMQKNHRIKTTTERPRKYYYTESTDAEEVEDVENSQSSNTNKIKEHDLYLLLTQFLSSELNIYSKRIDEKKSKNSYGQKGNKWLYPDLVGLEDLSKDWDDEIKKCVTQYADTKVKLWSFEVKLLVNLSNVREVFFQTVSNSSWANFGYLVASTLNDNALKELRILSGLHGIGVILLDTENPTDSQILIHAQEKPSVDWNTANRIASENKDFRQYIQAIRMGYQTGETNSSFWDTKD